MQFLFHTYEKEAGLEQILGGEENKYSAENLSFDQKIQLMQSGQVKPVILFFDESLYLFIIM